MEERISKRITKYFRENFRITENSRGTILVGDTPLKGRSVGKNVLKSLFTDRKSLEKINPELLYKSESELIDLFEVQMPNVSDELRHVISLERAKEIYGDEFETKVDLIYNSIPVVDVEDDSGNIVLLNKDTFRPIGVSERAWHKIVPKKQVEAAMSQVKAGRFVYNPRVTDPIIQGDEETFFNTYIPPVHAVERKPDIELDPTFEKFFNGFFEPSCRDYALNWIYYSVNNKLEDYLCLVGVGGTGKNLLAESIKYLHGPTNFNKAPNSSLTDKFNGHLANSTMVFYDECKFSTGSKKNTAPKNKLKQWQTNYLAVETKGKNAKNINIYCSGIIATNNDSDVYLEQIDRKFSVMEINKQRLIDRIGLDETERMWQYIKTDEFKHGFYNWLEANHNPEWNIHREYKGERFDELVRSSLAQWEHTLLFDYLRSGERTHYFIKDLQEEIPMLPSSAKLGDALYSYTDDGEPFGHLIYVEGKKCIKVADRYAPKIEEGDDL